MLLCNEITNQLVIHFNRVYKKINVPQYVWLQNPAVRSKWKKNRSKMVVTFTKIIVMLLVLIVRSSYLGNYFLIMTFRFFIF